MSAALKEDEPQGNPKKKRPAKKRAPAKPKEVNLLAAPTEHVVLPKPEEAEAQAKSPYPEGVQYFSYQPKDGGEPILLAVNGFENPTKVWLFDIAQMPWLSQTWAWMRKANIPKAIQRQAQLLPDDEYFDMFDEWFDVMKKMRGIAGPKGAVTAGK
jgi:hypothetical protein